MYLMLQKETPDDFVIATGESHRLADFAAVAFAQVGLDPKDHLVIDHRLLRPTEIMTGWGDAGKAATKLGWKPRLKMEDVARKMVQECQAEFIGDPNTAREQVTVRPLDIYNPSRPLLAK